MKILVIGGLGYTGSVLVSALLDSGHQASVVDLDLFESNFARADELDSFVKIDFRSLESEYFSQFDAIVHLANIANDPMVDLDPVLSWEVNVLGTVTLLQKLSEIHFSGKFIFASSGSVYGVRDELKVIESTPLTPISVYNKTKMSAERVCLSYSREFDVSIIRPGTVCGVSPRMRFDVAVNALVLNAIRAEKVIVNGGSQVRPHVHINDLCRIYIQLIEGVTPAGLYNAGFENIAMGDLGAMVSEMTGAVLKFDEKNFDPRSYRLCSDRVSSFGFTPENSVRDAVSELILYYKSEECLPESGFSIKWLTHKMKNSKVDWLPRS